MMRTIERSLGWLPHVPEDIDIAAVIGINDWLARYEQAVHRSIVSGQDREVVAKSRSIWHEVRDARERLGSLLEKGIGTPSRALDILTGLVREDIRIVASHELNVGLWGSEEARRIELYATRRAYELLRLIGRIDPEWAKKQEEFLELNI